MAAREMASKDKMLARVSDAVTLLVLAGLIAAPFLPARKSERTAAVAPARVVVQPAAKADLTPKRKLPDAEAATEPQPPVRKRQEQTQPEHTQPEPKQQDESTPPEPVVDVWTDAEQAAGLRECLRVLSPIAAEVELQEPVKKGACGMAAPVALHSIGGSSKVVFDPAPQMNCRLAADLVRWVETVLQPAAREVFGSRVTRIVGASSYSCRNMYSNPKLPLSQHALGSAVDIAGFVTEDGRRISVAKGWGPTERDIIAAQKKAVEAAKAAERKPDATAKDKSAKASGPSEASDASGAADASSDKGEGSKKAADKDQKPSVVKAGFKADAAKPSQVVAATAVLTAAKTSEAAFLKRLHHGACAVFGTVLGPEANDAHRDHFHFDVKERKRRGVCH